MTDEMIEAVARAIAYAQLTRQYVGKLKNIGVAIEIDRIWPEFKPEATAAIKAHKDALAIKALGIRPKEPTKEMVQSGSDVSMEISAAQAFHAWQAMWDRYEEPDG